MRGRTALDQSTDRSTRKDWWGIVVDAPDVAVLGHFYADLLGWEISSETETELALAPVDGVAYLAIQYEPNYVRPVWPAPPGGPHMMLHLDFEVDDLEAAVAHAVELGAVVAEFQPQDDVRVLLDPAGHPFCLYT